MHKTVVNAATLAASLVVSRTLAGHLARRREQKFEKNPFVIAMRNPTIVHSASPELRVWLDDIEIVNLNTPN